MSGEALAFKVTHLSDEQIGPFVGLSCNGTLLGGFTPAMARALANEFFKQATAVDLLLEAGPPYPANGVHQ